MRGNPLSTHADECVDALLHIWSRCHGCGVAPIVGERFECDICADGPNNDLCAHCYVRYADGQVQHPPPGSLNEITQSTTGPHTFSRRTNTEIQPSPRWLNVIAARVDAPLVPDHFVVRPEFCGGGESFLGSYGFIVAGSPPLFVTCLHVMAGVARARGVVTSLENPNYSGRELPALVGRVNLYDVFAKNWMMARLGHAAPMLVLPDARTRELEPFSQRDIAAFVVDGNADVVARPMASRVPDVGDAVWLAVASPGGSGRTIRCVVVESTERTFIFRYVDKSESIPRFTSGAPLLDADGDVAAMNVGLGVFEGHCFGHANHVSSIRRHLARR